MTDAELVRMLVNDDALSDDLVNFYLQLAEDFIKNYCHLESVPDALHNVKIQIAAVKLRANSDEGESSMGAGVSSVTSVSEAGQSISFGRVTSTKNFIGDDDLITTFKDVLNRFRRFDSGNPVYYRPLSKTRRIY